jgi:uncharacterized circularly permuted ATP-grasp superfamily protein
MSIQWRDYEVEDLYDELIRSTGRIRPWARPCARFFSGLDDEQLRRRNDAIRIAIRNMGVTFTVYAHGEGSIDRPWPLDAIPRMIPASEWTEIEKGLLQRVEALNRFIDDIYHDQKIIKDGVFPADILADSKNFRPECVGVDPPQRVWGHICGSDLVRDRDGTVRVLEDNLRVPSGVSYMLENRMVMKRVFPELFGLHSVLPVDDYPLALQSMLGSVSPRPSDHPSIVVLTPGIYNSAYFEHAFLAQAMGAELVEGPDLVVDSDDCVYMRTIAGLERVDVVYRRIDDLFLDPETFRPDSMIGVPGLMRAWLAGNVALVNAPGAGVADDKVVYAFVPAMIRYYLGEEPSLEHVPTFLCVDPKQRQHVLEHIDRMVLKPANEAGGYGIVIGPQASKAELRAVAEKIEEDPRNWVAQELVTLSTVPTVVGTGAAPRHVDLRPFILSGSDRYVSKGGLTRVALREGSTVVNSSQGGGSKDTWIVEDA